MIAVFTDNRDESGGSAQSVDVYAVGIPPQTGALCGNGAVEPGETCDGAALGGLTCAAVGCVNGTLKCAASCLAVDTTSCNGCAGAGAGHVPDSDLTPGIPLRVGTSGTDLALTWSAACGPAVDYEVYEGELGVSGSLAARLCSTSGATSVTLPPSAGDRYYLVVPISGGNEGSYGRTNGGTERAPAAAACFPQLIADCP